MESPIAEPIFREVLRRTPHDSARSQAALALARALRRQSERIGPPRVEPVSASGPSKEAEALCEEVIARYGAFRAGRQTMARAAEAELFELRHLGIGHEASQIEGPDLEGRPMALSTAPRRRGPEIPREGESPGEPASRRRLGRSLALPDPDPQIRWVVLSDDRGKVVVLEFWGIWCSVSRESSGSMRSQAERLKGRPAVVLGVNSDNIPGEAVSPRLGGSAERSWGDGGVYYGGPIAHRWKIKALPTTYIIDHRGIIRHKIGPRPDGHDAVCEIMDPAGKAHDKWRLRAEEIAIVVGGLIAEMEGRPDVATRVSERSLTP